MVEILVLGLAIYSTRNPDMVWETRAWRVLPVFALPLITTLLYSSCASFYRMRERKDQKTLERLRAERQAKIDELKEKTNYYLTQQLIQKYDLDPAAKAAAASVLASKLGAESGLKFALQAADLLDNDDTGRPSNLSRGIEKEGVDSSGLRNRKSLSQKSSQAARPNSGQTRFQGGESEGTVQMPEERGCRDMDAWEHQKEVEHHRGRPNEGGWIARLAAMLVGEDPTQCYALICGKCHMHNGLAKKEDYQYITYYCPHCHALNKSNQLEGNGGSDQTGRGGTALRHTSAPHEEVFSTSGGSLAPLQEAVSDSTLGSSPLLALIQEPDDELQSNVMGSPS